MPLSSPRWRIVPLRPLQYQTYNKMADIHQSFFRDLSRTVFGSHYLYHRKISFCQPRQWRTVDATARGTCKFPPVDNTLQRISSCRLNLKSIVEASGRIFSSIEYFLPQHAMAELNTTKQNRMYKGKVVFKWEDNPGLSTNYQRRRPSILPLIVVQVIIVGSAPSPSPVTSPINLKNLRALTLLTEDSCKVTCVGKHAEPCYRFHQILHFLGEMSSLLGSHFIANHQITGKAHECSP